MRISDWSSDVCSSDLPVANRVEGNKRPLSSMSPTIVYGPDGKVILALGSAGGKRIIMHVAKTLVGVLDWGLSAKDAIALRSEERRVGNECVSTCRSRWCA